MTKHIKKCCLLFATAIPVLLFAQGGSYVVKGKLSTLKTPAKVYMGYAVDGDYKRDSVEVKDGVFEFKGTVAEPQYATLLLTRTGQQARDAQAFYIEKGTITVTGKDSMATASITGGAVNKAFQKMRDMLKPVQKQQQNVWALYNAATPEQRKDPAFRASLEEKSKPLEKEEKRVLAQFIKENPNSIVSLYAINSYGGMVMDVNDVEPLYKMLSKQVQQTEQGKKWGATIEKLRAIAIGATAPSFVQNDTSGAPVKLEDFRGKYVLVDFWASWCKPCRAENPVVIKAYNKFKDKNFTIVGISLDTERNKAAWLKAIQEDGLPWTQVSDLQMKNAAAETYDVHAIPQNFLLDPQGKIIAKNLRGEELDKKLEEILGKG